MAEKKLEQVFEVIDTPSTYEKAIKTKEGTVLTFMEAIVLTLNKLDKIEKALA